MTAVQGFSVNIPTPEGVADAYLAYPEDGLPHPGVLLYMDAFGLRPALYAAADRLAGHGYTVLVPNVLYRHGRAPLVDLPQQVDAARRPEIFARLRGMIGELTPERVASDASAYLDRLAASRMVAPGPVGLTGYCMGARLALHTAAALPRRVAAVGCFHGGRLAIDDPNSPHLVVGNISAELYFGHADEDPSLPPEQRDRLDAALDAAGVRYRSEVYTGARHGYTQTDAEAYHPEAAERHWRELVALLDRNLVGATSR